MGSTETFHSLQALIYLVHGTVVVSAKIPLCAIFSSKRRPTEVEITEKERFWNLVKSLVVVGCNR